MSVDDDIWRELQLDAPVGPLDARQAITIGRVAMKRAKPALARQFFQQALNLSHLGKSAFFESETLAALATLEMRERKYEAASRFGEQALTVAGPLGNPAANTEACLTLSMTYAEIGLLDEARRLADDATHFATISGDVGQLSWSYTRKGDVMLLEQVIHGLPNQKETLRAYRIARQVARKANDPEPLTASLNNMLRLVSLMPQHWREHIKPPSRRLMQLMQAVGKRAFDRTEGPERAALRRIVEVNYAMVLAVGGNTDPAFALYERDLKKLRIDASAGSLEASVQYARVEIMRGATELGIQRLRDALKATQIISDLPVRVLARNILAGLAEAKGDIAAAYEQMHMLEREHQHHAMALRNIRAIIDNRVRTLREGVSQAAFAKVEAETDALTHLLNRRGFPAKISAALANAQESGQPFALAMIDIDRFKQVNDNHGHIAGDGVLKTVAQILQDHCNEGDLLGRFGGDEFVVGITGADKFGLSARCEKIRNAVHAIDPSQFGLRERLSLSIGVSDTHEVSDVNGLIHHADSRLYFAKRAGRNRVVHTAK